MWALAHPAETGQGVSAITCSPAGVARPVTQREPWATILSGTRDGANPWDSARLPSVYPPRLPAGRTTPYPQTNRHVCRLLLGVNRRRVLRTAGLAAAARL